MSRRVDRRVNSVAGVVKQFRAAEQAHESKSQSVKSNRQGGSSGKRGRK